MPGLVPNANTCCNPCDEPTSVAIPGPKGDDGAPCTPCTDGVNSFTTVNSYAPAAQPVMPAFGANVTLNVGTSLWMTATQVVYVNGMGYLEVQSKPTATSVILKNLETAGGEYASNAAPGTSFTAGIGISPGGLQGIAGTPAAGTYFAIANNLSEGTAATMRTNLGLGSSALLTAAQVFQVANNLSEGVAATKRANLGLVIGTNVQAYYALLQALSGLTTAVDQVIYSTGVNTVALTAFTPVARTLVAAATVAAQRAALNVLAGYGILGSRDAVDLNAPTTDYSVAMLSIKYRIDRVTLESPSGAVLAATAALWTATGGGGGAGIMLCADQALAATLTASTKFMDMVVQTIVTTDHRTEPTLYFRVGTQDGAVKTVNVKIYGWKYD